MPVVVPLIAAAAAAAASAGAAAALTGAVIFGVTISATAATIIGGLIGAVVSFAVGYVASALLGSGAKSSSDSTAASTAASVADRTQQVRQSIASHRIIVGSVKVSGVLCFLWSPNYARAGFASAVKGGVPVDYKPNQLLYTALVVSGHPVAAIHDITLDDTPVGDAKFAGLARVEPSLGLTDQVANTTFINETDGAWTSAHRLLGRAALFCVFSYDQAAFSGVPNPAAIVQGAMPYDPRTGQVAWSDNPALIIAWYLTQPFGLRCEPEEIDQPSLIAAANICDELIALRNGSSEKRYTCNGTWTLDETPSSVLDKLKACMDGGLIYSGGIWYIFAGATVAPSYALTQDHLRGPVVVQANRAARDSFNAVRGTYIRPDANWQATDAPVRYDEAAVAADGGTYYQDFDFPFTTSGYAVQRLMQIALRRNRAERSVQLQLNMAGLCIRPWDVVTFGTDRLPTANYRVTNWTLAETGVDVTLELEPSGIYAWDPATDELDIGDPAQTSLPSAYTLSQPTIAIATPAAAVPLVVGVTAGPVPGSTYAEIQWQPSGSSTWVAAPVAGYSVQTAPGGVASYRARSRADGAISDWTTVTPPAAPAYLGVSCAGGLAIEVAWQPSQSAQVFAGNSSDASTAALAFSGGTGTGSFNADAAGQRFVWARMVDAFGNVGPFAGPVGVTAGTAGSGGAVGSPSNGGGTPTDPGGGSGGSNEGGSA